MLKGGEVNLVRLAAEAATLRTLLLRGFVSVKRINGVAWQLSFLTVDVGFVRQDVCVFSPVCPLKGGAESLYGARCSGSDAVHISISDCFVSKESKQGGVALILFTQRMVAELERICFIGST